MEHPVKSSKPSKGDDDEFDFGAPATKGGASSSGVSGQLKEEDLMNPMKFSLHRVDLKRAAGQRLGLEVEMVSSGVIKVVGVIGKGPSASAGIEKGMYVVSVDGKRVETDAGLKEVEKSGRRHLRMALVKPRPSHLQPNAFPSPPMPNDNPCHLEAGSEERCESGSGNRREGRSSVHFPSGQRRRGGESRSSSGRSNRGCGRRGDSETGRLQNDGTEKWRKPAGHDRGTSTTTTASPSSPEAA